MVCQPSHLLNHQPREVRWFDVYQLASGKIVTYSGVGDELGLLQQLWFELVLPTPTASVHTPHSTGAARSAAPCTTQP
jgi:hypothetical protein